MRTSTAALGQSDSRMFTLVVQGLGGPSQRTAERRLSVCFSQMQATLRLINQQGLAFFRSRRSGTPRG